MFVRNVIWHVRLDLLLFYHIATQSGALVGGLPVLWHKRYVGKTGCIYSAVPCCFQQSSHKFVHWLGDWRGGSGCAWRKVCPSHPPVQIVQTIWIGVDDGDTQPRPPSSTCSSINLVPFVADADIFVLLLLLCCNW
jgi:hypothetical protein